MNPRINIKEQAHKIIDSLPENIELEDVIQALSVNAQFAHGENEIRDGKGIQNSDAIKLINSWRK